MVVERGAKRLAAQAEVGAAELGVLDLELAAELLDLAVEHVVLLLELAYAQQRWRDRRDLIGGEREHRLELRYRLLELQGEEGGEGVRS